LTALRRWGPKTRVWRVGFVSVDGQKLWIKDKSRKEMSGCRMSLKDILENDPEAYFDKSELLGPLKVMYESLVSTNDLLIANGHLLDCIRQVHLTRKPVFATWWWWWGGGALLETYIFKCIV
jgi:hypothetical protein